MERVFQVECEACSRTGLPGFHSARVNIEQDSQPGSFLFPATTKKFEKSSCDCARNRPSAGRVGRILDPRSKCVLRWNRLVVLARGLSLFFDPYYFFAICVSASSKPCFYMDGRVVTAATALRTVVDAVHLCHLLVQFRMAFVSKESLVVGCGKLVWDPRAIPAHYARSVKGFWLDAFVILPLPQLVYWIAIPKWLRDGEIERIMTVTQIIFLLQYIPKVYHTLYILRALRQVTGYIFGTIWWGFALNFIAFLLGSHLSGAYWYILSMQRIGLCLRQQCDGKELCRPVSLACSTQICYRNFYGSCGGNSTMDIPPMCLDPTPVFPYGIYANVLHLIPLNSVILNILYAYMFGIMGISSMGNSLEPTMQWEEALFSTIMVMSGLLLFTLLVGNIQVRYRDMRWWMKRRQLPSKLRRRVREFEYQRWAIMGGQEEFELIKHLPDGLRRDIKRYLCIDLIKKVPLFHNLDDVILDNICDRVKPQVFTRGEKIMREGDPVNSLVFIVCGQIKRFQTLSKGNVLTSILEPGGFIGEELLSWCLRRRFTERFPASSAAFICVDPTEAFVLDYDHLLYITDHFHHTLANNKLKCKARYYSSNWRTWAAVRIQFAWRRYLRTRGLANHSQQVGGGQQRLRHYAALFLSLKPHDHLE